MSDGSTVRLIDINESVDSEDDIELFYTKLDKMKGRDAKGDTTDAAQVTGAISVDSIAYAHYVELTARYPEIKINANKIICTVNFFNEGVLFKSQSVIQGKDADNPGIPTKAASADGHYYYTFNSWDKSYLSVQTDLDINAIFDTNVQVYRLFYVTRSVAIATPAYEDIKWGEYAHSPELSNIPDEVQFTG